MMAEGDINANIVQARQFQLVDDQNNVLALLGSGPNGSAGLEIYKGDTPRLSLGTDETGRVSLSLRDNAGTISVRLAVDSSGSPTVFTFRDAPERVRAQILLQDDGAVGVTLTDGMGAERVNITVLADGLALVGLYDKDGNPSDGLANERLED